MLNDTEVPSAPQEWIGAVHGALVLVDRVRADGWEMIDDPAGVDAAEVVPGVLSTVERGAGLSLMLAEPDETSRSCLLDLDGAGVLVVTHLGGEGGPDLRVAARDVPDEAYTATEVTFEAGFVGVVLFDGSSSWEMASERMLYAFAETRKGYYQVDVCPETRTESGKRLRVVRLRFLG